MTDDTIETYPQLSDWPASYAELVREGECWGESDETLLEVLCERHEAMRFGRHIDFNIRHGFYCEPGHGVADLARGADCGHLLEVLDGVTDGIDITATGDMCWSPASFAEHYVSRAADKLSWFFTQAVGPRLLVAEHHERKGEHFYFVLAYFLCKADDAAFMARFSEAQA